MTIRRIATKENTRRTFAKSIKNARINSDPKLTQLQVAELFTPHLSRGAVAQWEVGESLPDVDRLVVLSKAFGVTLDSLVFGEFHNAPEELSAEALKMAKGFMKLPKRQRDAFFTLLVAQIKAKG